MRKRVPIRVVAALLVVGCQTGTLPSPNDPNDVGLLSGENIQDQLRSISDSLALHRDRGEITEATYEDLMAESAKKLLTGFKPEKIDATRAWKYGYAQITARDWPAAKSTLEIAIQAAKLAHNEDRRVNDCLKLARVYAEMGQVDEAIKTVRSVFNAGPEDSAPILFATLYDIVPVARGKHKDVELAKLLEETIAIDLKVRVDPNLREGRKFLNSRPHHLRNAWRAISSLYTDANRPDLAAQAQLNEETMGHEFAQDQPRRV